MDLPAPHRSSIGRGSTSSRKSTEGSSGSGRKSFDPKQREIQESANSVFIHTSDKVNPASLVRVFEEEVGAGCVEKYFFRDKQNFGFIQFTRTEVKKYNRPINII